MPRKRDSESPERWKWIPFFPDYAVSDRGRVRSRKSGKPRIIKPHTITRGDRKKSYLRVTLYNRGGKKHKRVHRLVALAFIPRPAGKNTVNHIDGRTRNNRVENLAWTTSAENTKHAWHTGLMKNSAGARWRKQRGK